MPGKHAIFSPSGFKALMLCPAKPAMERGLPDASSDYADEGTAAHFLAAACLANGEQAAAHINEDIVLWRHDDSDGEGTGWASQFVQNADIDVLNTFTVDVDMADAVQVYIDTVRDYQAGGELLVEQSLPIGHITGEDDAEGTCDTVILRDREIIVIDLKYGRGVEVSAIDNPQLMLYGLGALEKYALLGDFDTVRMVISQPRLSAAPSEFAMTVPALVEWGISHADPAAKLARTIYESSDAPHAHATPAPDACRFCKAKGSCPALAASVQSALSAEFTDLTTKDATAQEQIVKQLVAAVPDEQLGAKLDAVELVEMWCKAVRGRAESELLAGREVPGYKLVPGKRGARAWADEAEAEKLLKAFRLKKDEMYDLKLISPTTAEKKLKSTPKRWAKVQPLIKQGEGKPSVAPVTDPRPALEIKPIESEFAAIAEGAEDLV